MAFKLLPITISIQILLQRAVQVEEPRPPSNVLLIIAVFLSLNYIGSFFGCFGNKIQESNNGIGVNVTSSTIMNVLLLNRS